ncbi:2-hydroxyglutarate dehydrogenase [Myxococcaceae bacterium]|nr:2-hydroxyglutarate dehydrogenase [Myxococcaceae bacterium]
MIPGRPEVDVAVIGAGIVGLATAAAFARKRRSVLVVERHDAIARETTSRSSEVLHAGLYYPPGSSKARFCVAGRERIEERCARLGIPARRTGKLVVATDPAEVEVLERLRRIGTENGASGLEIIGAEAVASLEPSVRAVAALFSPATGIVDAHALSLSFLAEAEGAGALLALRSEVRGIEKIAGGYRLRVRDADGTVSSVVCAAVVNAAGLGSDRIAALAGLDVDACGYRLHPCKGDYFALAPGAPVRISRLVYPVPAEAGLGIHATLDLGGRIRFGPDARYVETASYEVDATRREAFAAAIRRYLPDLRDDWLSPDYAGIRPKLAGPGEGFRDFVVAEESARGLAGFVNLVGIESPGLTASAAIAEHVASLVASV